MTDLKTAGPSIRPSIAMMPSKESKGPEPITGGCLCGSVRYTAMAAPKVHYCHCTMCRRATGSAFAVLSWVPTDKLLWVGETPTERRSSPIARRGFCNRCGTPLTLAYDGADEMALHAGTFDRPDAFAPGYHYGVESRLAWADCGSALPVERTREAWDQEHSPSAPT